MTSDQTPPQPETSEGSSNTPKKDVSKPRDVGKLSLGVLLGLAAILGVGAGGLAIYVNGTGTDNAETASSCALSQERMAALDAAAQGEVAAFAVVDEGRPVPDMTFADDSGAMRAMSEWHGKTVVFNLWATWCAPCREEMPMLDNLQAMHGGDDFEVVAVSIDTQERANPRGFLEEIEVAALEFYQDDTADLFQDLRAAGLAFGMPTTLLIDDEGCLQGFLAGPAHWDHPDAVALVEAAKID